VQILGQTSTGILCGSLVSLLQKKDVALIERIQKRFTKMIPSVKHLPFETRLQKLKLWPLEDRHIRPDLIEVFKIIHGLSSVNFSTFFEYSTHNRTRDHSVKLNKKRSRLDLRQHFFSERVINIWNSLDNKTVTATSLNYFKSYLDIVHKDGSFSELRQSV